MEMLDKVVLVQVVYKDSHLNMTQYIRVAFIVIDTSKFEVYFYLWFIQFSIC
jgi:hypothetical protein